MTLEALSPLWADGVRELCNHLWQSTLFFGIASILAVLLRKNQARIRHWLWMAASAKFLIPFSLLISLGSHLHWPGHAVAPKTGAYVAIETVSQPFLEAPNKSLAVPTVQPTASYVPILPLVLTVVWLSGFIAMMVFWCVQWWRISRLVRSATPLIEGREIGLLRKAEHIARLARPVPLLPSGNSMEPGVFGIIHPVLLWPEGIARHMDDAHLESVLTHEMCHVKRRDNLTSAIHMLVETIFCFYPAVWWIERRLVKERERACDEAVVLLGNEAGVYAESILDVCKFFTESPTACISGVMGSDLKQRIASILSGPGERKLDLRRKAMLALACVLSMGVPLAAGFLRSAQGQAQSAQQNGIENGGIVDKWQGTEHTPDGHDLPMVLETAKDEKGAPQVPTSERKLEFDVASVRENKTSEPPYSNFPLGPGPVFGVKDGLMLAKNQTLLGYIFFAFKPDMLQSQQFQAQLPGWVKATSYDIEARASGSPTKDDMRLMMQSLLEERFHLVIHLETREAPVYALVLAKPGTLGPRIKPHPADDPDCAKTKLTKTTTGHDATCGASSPIVPMTPDDFATAVYNMPMDAIAVELGRTAGLGRVSSMIGRRVVNRTGLTGSYDYMLEFAPEQELNAQPDASVDSEPGGPSFTAAVKNQLGLKLVPQKLPVEVIVVDHIERPSEN